MNKAAYSHLLHTYGRNPKQWFGFVAVLINIFVVRVYVVIIMAQVASHVAAGDLSTAKREAVYYLIAYVLGAIIGTIGELASLDAENTQYGKLMMIYHYKLINKDMSFYRDNQTGYLATVFRQYLDASMLLVRYLRGEALGAVVSLTVPSIVLLVVAPKVGLIACVIILVQVGYIFWSSSKATKYRHMSNEVYRKLTGEVSDEITNIVAFKSAGVDQSAQQKISQLRKQEEHAFWQRRKISTLLDLPRGILTSVGITWAIYVIVDGASGHAPTSLGLIVLTLTYMFQILRNVAALPELIATHDDLVTKLYPTLQYLKDDYETIRNPTHPQKLAVTAGAITIDNVKFSYPSASGQKRVMVFDGLSITIKGREQVGIVGLSGAGKSTLTNLLLRFDDVDAGAITIDGTDIRQVTQTDLRAHIAYVPQEPLLFHRTVRENIAYFNDSASESAIIEAARAAHAHEFITQLPNGYDTMVGERGVKLSGGQKQRVAIARAVLKRAPIMVFDEATSALDSESEQIIQRALPQILGKQTAIVVAHRLSTVAGLDRIIVMHEGRVVEEGSQVELLRQQGRYYSLWQKQTTEFKNK